MGRKELERKLRALGYAPTGKMSGNNHVVWFGRGRKVIVPVYEIIFDSTAARILEDAER
jgi:hypothetical protein